MALYKRFFGAAILVMAVTVAACDDIPVLPQWDADIYVPLGGSKLNGVTPGVVIPPNSSANVPGDIRTLTLDGTAGDILNRAFDATQPVIKLELRVTKTANLAVSLADTILLAADSASLATTSVRHGFTMAANQTFIIDTLQLGPNGIALLQQLVDNNGTLHVQPRGRVSSGNSAVTVQNSDSIFVKIGALVRVPVAGGR